MCNSLSLFEKKMFNQQMMYSVIVIIGERGVYNWMIFKFLSGVDELSLPFFGKINRYLYSSLELEIFYFYCCCVFHFLLVSLFVCLYPLIGTPSFFFFYFYFYFT